MAKILDLTKKQVKDILCDMLVLGRDFKEPPRVISRTHVYVDDLETTNNIDKLLFCHETLVLIDIKHSLEAAMFWDVLGKKPRNVPENWLNQSKSFTYLKEHNITLAFS